MMVGNAVVVYVVDHHQRLSVIIRDLSVYLEINVVPLQAFLVRILKKLSY